MRRWKAQKNSRGFTLSGRPQLALFKTNIEGQIKNALSGFTIVELIVVISIFTVISTLILINYPHFAQDSSLRGATQAMASAFQKTESLALGVGEFGGFFPGFGIYFLRATPDEYIIFADQNLNGIYDGVSENKEVFKLTSFPKIAKLCVDTETLPPGDCSNITTLNILYLRPNPFITLLSNLGEHSNVKIVLETPNGNKRSVIVWISGQVEIKEGE